MPDGLESVQGSRDAARTALEMEGHLHRPRLAHLPREPLQQEAVRQRWRLVPQPALPERQARIGLHDVLRHAQASEPVHVGDVRVYRLRDHAIAALQRLEGLAPHGAGGFAVEASFQDEGKGIPLWLDFQCGPGRRHTCLLYRQAGANPINDTV